MSAWRREALAHLPRHRDLIEHSPTVRALWADLWPEFEAAYREPRDEALIAGVYAFALWCWHGPERPTPHGPEYRGNSVGLITEVFGGFFERLPQDPVRRRDMPRWLCLKEFEVLRGGPLRYFLEPDEHARMVREFRQAKASRGESDPARCARLRLTLPSDGPL